MTVITLYLKHKKILQSSTSIQLNIVNLKAKFCQTRSFTFMRKKVTGFNGKKVQKRMSRRGSHWPLVLWLHFTGHGRSRSNLTFDIESLPFENLTTIVADCFR